LNELSLRAAEAAVSTVNESVQTNGKFVSGEMGVTRDRAIHRVTTAQFFNLGLKVTPFFGLHP